MQFQAIKPPLHDQITEMQQKIQLLEGERTSYYERSQDSIKRNRETIQQLRQGNKSLHQKLANVLAGDLDVVKAAFENRGPEKDAYRNMSAKAALAVLDQKVLNKTNRLNAMKHTTHTLCKHLEELRLQSQRLKPEGRVLSNYDATFMHKCEDHARQLRLLENRLDKAKMRCQEAEHIMREYIRVKNHLQDESLTFQDKLDSLEADILKLREEHHNLQVTNTDAQLSKDTAKAELLQLEELLQQERKERELVISRLRRLVEERKSQSEKADRRAQRVPILPDELSSEPQRSTTRMVGEEETISTFEEAFQCIKEAIGVTNIQEIAERFISQGETHKHLENMKKEQEGILLQLKKERERLQKQFQDLKYSGETKHSSGQQMQEECRQQLRAEQQRFEATKERLTWFLKTLHTVRTGVEHLADKLQHITLDQSEVPLLSPDSEEYTVELLVQCELKLQLLQQEFRGVDHVVVMKEIEDEEFLVKIEGKLPDSNTRIRLPEDTISAEEESEEEEAEIISREALKRQSQLIIDSKTKRKHRRKRKLQY